MTIFLVNQTISNFYLCNECGRATLITRQAGFVTKCFLSFSIPILLLTNIINAKV
uniref:Uncharacterized protein n=1 Tax=Papilio polytes TaxID=76194 RepID=I4DN53_PAPPL|nr:unknown unsecreted protein [Papilio polytes]